MEGAIWMGNRLTNEIKGMLVAFEYLVEELTQRWYQQLRRDEKSGESSQNPLQTSFLYGDKGGGQLAP